MERTLIIVKPDAIGRGIILETLIPFERKGFKLIAIKMILANKDILEKHYTHLKNEKFFTGLIEFMLSKPLIVTIWEGKEVVDYARKILGATDPLKAELGTIRGNLALDIGRNTLHASDNLESAQREIDLWFNNKDIFNYKREIDKLIYEKL